MREMQIVPVGVKVINSLEKQLLKVLADDKLDDEQRMIMYHQLILRARTKRPEPKRNMSTQTIGPSTSTQTEKPNMSTQTTSEDFEEVAAEEKKLDEQKEANIKMYYEQKALEEKREAEEAQRRADQTRRERREAEEREKQQHEEEERAALA